jgi:hypothetical protein
MRVNADKEGEEGDEVLRKPHALEIVPPGPSKPMRNPLHIPHAVSLFFSEVL